LDCIDHDISKVFIRQGPDDIEECRPWSIKQGQEDHPEDMFQFWIPVSSEEFFEDIDKSLC